MKKAIVSTSIGCEGIDVTDRKDILIADQPEAFADSIVKLFMDRSLALQLGENSRRLIEAKYSWSKIAEKLEHIYRKI